MSTPCIEWTKGRHKQGYGKVRIEGKTLLAHRLAWETVHGPIPKGMCICHHCDNPPCVNPEHLFLGTYRDNAQDMIRKGRKADNSGALNGMSKLTVDAVSAMRRLRVADPGRYTHKVLADLFKVSRAGVGLALSGATWPTVTEATAPTGPARGELAGLARLTEAQVREARRLRELPGKPYSGRQLAKAFGVGSTTMRKALDRVTWKHVE